jgi:hypothetical protein
MAGGFLKNFPNTLRSFLYPAILLDFFSSSLVLGLLSLWFGALTVHDLLNIDEYVKTS